MPRARRDPVDVNVDVPARPDESRERVQRAPGIGKVVEDADGHDDIESSIHERQLLGVRLHRCDLGGKVPPRDVDRVADVYSNDLCAEPVCLVAVAPRTGTDVKHEAASKRLRLVRTQVLAEVALPLGSQPAEMLPLVGEALRGSPAQLIFHL